ncbi:MAG: ROK family protein [Pseudomonadota bacterium]|nr:ROK family protein [Pseudomonadota bacterium]
MGAPGNTHPKTGLHMSCFSAGLAGNPLTRDLTDKLGMPVRVENDANCFALAEAMAGAGRGSDVVIGVTLGTSVGGGTAINGSVLKGRHNSAMEFGHTELPYRKVEMDEEPGVTCKCGKPNCLREWISGNGFAARFKETDGRALTSHEIIQGSRNGDKKCIQAVANLKDRLARALANLINFKDPDMIVLGGGLATNPELFEGLDELIRPYCYSSMIKNEGLQTRILPAELGDSAGKYGAAWLFKANEYLPDLKSDTSYVTRPGRRPTM